MCQSNTDLNSQPNSCQRQRERQQQPHKPSVHSADNKLSKPNQQSDYQQTNQTATWSGGNTRQPHLGVWQHVALDKNNRAMFVITVPRCTIKWRRLTLCRTQRDYIFVCPKKSICQVPSQQASTCTVQHSTVQCSVSCTCWVYLETTGQVNYTLLTQVEVSLCQNDTGFCHN